MTRIIHVLNLGAGVQSTALALMEQKGLLLQRDLDKGTDAARHKLQAVTGDEPIKFTAAVFADTGDEPRDVYTHLGWLIEQVDFPILIRSVSARRNAIFKKLTPLEGPTNKGRVRRIL